MQPLASNGYSVFFDNDFAQLSDFLQKGDYSKVFFLTDTNTSVHCLPLINEALPWLTNFDIIEIDAGEENKNIDYCIGIWKMLLDFGADRKSLLINVGGGVVTDIGGFAAATFKRGIRFINIPTSLLAQVDASIGGKTGIDISNIKNIVGTFSTPDAVFISDVFLASLDRRQLVSGFAEIIKHGLIADEAYYKEIQSCGPEAAGSAIIRRSVEIKNEVVTQDPHESGLRKILNFGHTVGHAIEAFFLDRKGKSLLHGEALAAGMICEAYLSYKHHTLSHEDLSQLSAYLFSVYGSISLLPEYEQVMLDYMKNDKKNVNGQTGFSLLKRVGACDYNQYLNDEQILESFAYYKQTASAMKIAGSKS